MSLVQTDALRQRGIVGICVAACVCVRLMRRAHNFGGLREANHPGVCQMDRRFYIVECNLNR